MLLLYGFALLAGVASAIEPGQNASLAKSFAHPLLAGAVSLAISLLAFAILLPVMGELAFPGWEKALQAPWWAWLGGVSSALLALAQLYVSKRIGAAPFLGLIVTAGVVTSIILDNYGLVGFKIHEASIWRVVGGALMVVGVGFIAVF